VNATVDLADTEMFVTGDPHAAWAWLRANAPVYHNPTQDFWALTKHQDLSAVYVDHVAFSSEQGTVMGGSFRSGTDTATGKMLICADPPDHRLLRQQVHQGFANWMIDKIAVTVREYVDAGFDRLIADGGGDLACGLALELPAAVLAAMFGLSRSEAYYLLDLTREMIGFSDGEYVGDNAQMTLVAAQVKIFDFLVDLTERRRRNPGDDLPSVLLKSGINGRGLDDGQILYNCMNVVVGGNETTPYTACAGTLALLQYSDQAERFYSDASVLPTAIEEILRWTSTNAYVGRTVMKDVTIRGVDIPAGAKLTLWNASANRDEDVFADPQRFDLTRTPNPHLAFGVGIHRCIGQVVARKEVSIYFAALRERGLRLQLSAEVERLRSNFMLGTKHMPVAVVAHD
jgi:cytochrome P450